MESRAAEKCRISELEYRSGKRRIDQAVAVYTELIIVNRKGTSCDYSNGPSVVVLFVVA
jgi:hypothetical protein